MRLKAGLLALFALASAIAILATVTPNRAVAASSCDRQWQVVPTYDHSQLSGEIDGLNAVAALASGDQWAVGTWAKYPDAYSFHTLIEHWDAATDAWTVVPSRDTAALNNHLYGVDAVASDDAWAVGGSDEGNSYNTLVEHWDGTSWSIVPAASFPGVLYAVAAVGPDDVWAVGSENYPGRGLIEHWNGTTWSAAYLRFAALLRGVTAVGKRTVWAVGQRYGVRNPFGDTTLTLRFKGRVWQEVSSPNPLSGNDTDQNWLTSVSAASEKDIWAVGRYGNHDLGLFDHTLIEHWNGSRWSVVPSPNPGGPSVDNDLWSVVAAGAGDVWAVGGVGAFLNPQASAPLAFHRDGSQWSEVTVSAPTAGELFGVAAEPMGGGISAVGDTIKPAQPNPFVGTLAEHLCPG